MLRKALANKVSSQAGETLVEALVALTVAALCLVMLAMTIAVSTKFVAEGAVTADNYYAQSNVLAMAPADGTASIRVTVSGDGSATATSSTVAVDYELYENIPGGGDAVSYRATGSAGS